MNKNILHLSDYLLESQEEKERFSSLRYKLLIEYLGKFRDYLMDLRGVDNKNELTPYQAKCLDNAMEHVDYVFTNVVYDQNEDRDYKYVNIQELRNKYEKATEYFKHMIDSRNKIDMEFYKKMNEFDRHGRANKFKIAYKELMHDEEYGEDDPTKRYLDDIF